MEQRLIIEIGYADYAVDAADAAALLQIAMRSTRVKRSGYTSTDHYYPDSEETKPFATRCEIGNFGPAPSSELKQEAPARDDEVVL